MNFISLGKWISIIAVISLIIGVAALLGWAFEFRGFLGINESDANMKVNTALLFFITGIDLLLFTKKESIYKVFHIVLITTILVISSVTIFEYVDIVSFSIDNLIINDTISNTLPGRMSPATAICFLLIALGLLGIDIIKVRRTIWVELLFILVLIIAFISLVSYFLNIAMLNKASFLSTMSVKTSVLFLLISSTYAISKPYFGFHQIITSKSAGSRLFRILVPITLILPIVLSYLLLIALRLQLFTTGFGIVLYTVTYIIFSIGYLVVVSRNANASDLKRKSLEEHLKSTNQQLQQFNKALNQVALISMADHEGKIIQVNDIFCEVTKMTREEILGRTHFELDTIPRKNEFYSKINNALKNGEIWVGEVEHKSEKSERVWTLTAIVPFLNNEGNLYQTMFIEQDITKTKEAEELLPSEFIKTLKAKNKELEQFVYIASHDLQEPIRTVKSFAELLNDEIQEVSQPETAKTALRFLIEASERMGNLVKGLLDYSRIGRKIELTKIDTTTLAKDVVTDLHSQIRSQSAKIIIGNLPTIEVFEVMFRLLLQNLITNGLKFNKVNTSPIIHVDAIEHKHTWEFTIKDNGIGIRTTHQAKIFAIFQRLHSNKEYEGTGIGLAQCQKIVDLHGGKIWVKSVLGEGSTFHFTIPKQISIVSTSIAE